MKCPHLPYRANNVMTKMVHWQWGESTQPAFNTEPGLTV